MAAPVPPDENPSPTRSVRRLLVAVVLSLLILAFPYLGAVISYRMNQEPLQPDQVVRATFVALSLVGTAWGGLLLIRLFRRARWRALASDHIINEPEMLRAILAARDIACPQCGYNLRGLPGGSCPECDRPIAIHIAAANPVRPMIWTVRLALAAVAAHAAYWGVSGTFIALRYGPTFRMLPLTYFVSFLLGQLVTVGGLVALAIGVRWSMVAPGPAMQEAARWRVLRIALVILGLLGLVGLAGYLTRVL